ncbi:hypothetical protein BTW28_08405 [Citrobacter freundii]|nr:hypothetical protein BTW28_08405 [Citrobacter freundii]ATX01056.1 hypothetical protein CU079_05140 [Citrobacter freundii]AUT94549.1 hypothetical protein MC47_003880 [Citrobacter freundii]AVH83777.1 hypothetical protein A6J81_25490 [Citrobacter braakii]ROW34281.1 hypothetical protein C3454_21610 [Citrobacter europaeus]
MNRATMAHKAEQKPVQAQMQIPYYISSFNLPLRWLHLLTTVTYFSKLLWILRFAALTHIE